MGLFNNFPYTDFHRLNLDWILKFTKSVRDRLDLIDATVTNVQAARDAAEGYATDAENSASEAAASRDNAYQAAQRATSSATAASQSATAAAGSASTAQQSKTAAAKSASTAQQSATAAQTAQTAAEAAQTAAEAAAGSVDPSGNIYVVHVSNATVYDLDASNKSLVCADSPAFDHYNRVAQNHAPVYAVPHFTNASYNLVLSGNRYMGGRYVPQWHVVDAVGNDVPAGSFVSFDIYLIPQNRCTESQGSNSIPS